MDKRDGLLDLEGDENGKQPYLSLVPCDDVKNDIDDPFSRTITILSHSTK